MGLGVKYEDGKGEMMSDEQVTSRKFQADFWQWYFQTAFIIMG